MNYYNEIKNKLIDNEIYSKVKDYSKERNRVITYFEIGKLLDEAGKEYGKNIIEQYSKKLMIEVGKKYNKRTLFRMRQFYKVFSNKKVSALLTQLTWSHYLELISIRNIDEIVYYIRVSISQNLNYRQLSKKIKDKEYERLSDETKKNLIINKSQEVGDLIKNPILINNRNKYEVITEKILQRIILEDISLFLKELGNGFTFIDNEYKIKIGERYNYIDLLLFNYEYNCFIVCELKVTELKKEYIGQIQLYMNYIDKNLRSDIHNKTIGIIICKKDNKYVMGYCSDERIFRTTYKINI